MMKRLSKLLRAWAEKLDPQPPTLRVPMEYRGEPVEIVHLVTPVDFSEVYHEDPKVEDDNVIYIKERTEDALAAQVTALVRWTHASASPRYSKAELLVLRFTDDGPR